MQTKSDYVERRKKKWHESEHELRSRRRFTKSVFGRRIIRRFIISQEGVFQVVSP